MLEPSFVIDATEPPWRLALQQSFDVERSARHFSSSLTDTQYLSLTSGLNGRFFLSGPLVRQKPDVSLDAECAALAHYLVTHFRETRGEYEVAYQDFPYLPEMIARKAKMRRNGRDLDDAVWEVKQKESGYWMPEHVLLSERMGLRLEKITIYEESAMGGEKSVLTRSEEGKEGDLMLFLRLRLG